MTEHEVYSWSVWCWLSLTVVIAVALLFITAPYGRHARRGWGPSLPARWGWVLMELPSPALMAVLFFSGPRTGALMPLVFLLLWQLHYLQRTFLYPALMRPGATPIPLSIVLFGVLFNAGNAWFNGRWLFDLSPAYEASWLVDPRFVLGTLLFLAGFVVNVQSDAILRNLREPGEHGYRVPQGGLYRWVSCPNYLGEMMEWAGWALLTWSVAGLSFFLWTVANLLPRALSNHRWYRETFADYPRKRRAALPFVL